MSQSSRAQTTRAYWHKVCAALPAVAMIGGGIALTAHAEPTRTIKGVAASNGSPAIVVPSVALAIPSDSADPALPSTPSTLSIPPLASTLPDPSLSKSVKVASSAPAQISGDAIAVAAPLTPTLAVPSGIVFSASNPVTSDDTGIPIRALEGYRLAVSLIDTADPDCKIDWALLAAIGSVESDHARFGGNQLDSAGVAQPGIIGIPLDGSNGTARITDTDGGALDRDSVLDRAVGPMQFIPSTWRLAGADADGDGVKNPQNMADAAAASAIYLCSGPGDLSQPGDLRAAILRYNNSDAYVQKVTALASAYRLGVNALPASDLPASELSAASDLAVLGRSPFDRSRSDRPSAGTATSTFVAAAPAQTVKVAPTTAMRRSSATPTALPSVRRPAATPVAPLAIAPLRTPVAAKPTSVAPKTPAPAQSTPTPAPARSTQTSTPTPTPAAPTQSPAPAVPTQSPAPAVPTQSTSPAAPTQSPAPAVPTQSPSPATSTSTPTPCLPESDDDGVAQPEDNSGRDPAKC